MPLLVDTWIVYVTGAPEYIQRPRFVAGGQVSRTMEGIKVSRHFDGHDARIFSIR